MSRAPFTVYEFFAGGGMARLGLGERWTCAFANDFDRVKATTYRENFPEAGVTFTRETSGSCPWLICQAAPI